MMITTIMTCDADVLRRLNPSWCHDARKARAASSYGIRPKGKPEAAKLDTTAVTADLERDDVTIAQGGYETQRISCTCYDVRKPSSAGMRRQVSTLLQWYRYQRIRGSAPNMSTGDAYTLLTGHYQPMFLSTRRQSRLRLSSAQILPSASMWFPHT